MKSNLVLLLMFFCTSISAQITDLYKLSQGKYYSSDVIKDEKNNIKGYFLLFEIDKVEKETYDLEYVVLDENLQKVTNGIITEMKYESLLISAKKIIVEVTLFNNKLLIQLSDYLGEENGNAYLRYKILDLQSNKLTTTFAYLKDNLAINPVLDRKLKNFSENQTYKTYGLDKVGIVVNKGYKDKYSDAKSLVCYDENLKQIWKLDYELEKNEFGRKELTLLKSNEKYITFFNHYEKGGYNKSTVSVLIVDAKKGKVNTEYFFPNENNNSYKVVDCQINEDNLVLLGNYSKKNDFGFILDEDNLGIFKITLNAKNGKVVEEKYLDWLSIASKFNINKHGYIKDEGNIFIHNIITLSNNKSIVVCEAFKNSPITSNNIYFLELTKDFSLNQVLEINKFRNKYPGTTAHSRNIKKYGLFDFMDYQNMGDDELLFYFSDNEKNSKNRKNSTLFGIVSYSEGKFNKQSLNLKTEVSSITAFPAKKGYIMLIENFDEINKSTELRLEKINY